MTFENQTPEMSTLADFSTLPGPGSSIRHILLGHPGNIRQTIHLLHNLRYVETSQWSPLIEVPEQRLILRPGPDEMISMLVRRLYASYGVLGQQSGSPLCSQSVFRFGLVMERF